jgi:hypothetical protein
VSFSLVSFSAVIEGPARRKQLEVCKMMYLEQIVAQGAEVLKDNSSYG